MDSDVWAPPHRHGKLGPLGWRKLQ
jgi:hypothetical protein